MTLAEIRLRRLLNQQIVATTFTKPEEIVHWMGAMQAQEFTMAKWAIGLRLQGSTEKQIEDAFNQGRILRTHLLRPTWHFVSPFDIRWLLLITAPQILARNKYYLAKAELNEKILRRTNHLLSKELENNQYKTRTQLQEVLASNKIKAEGMRLAYIMMQAELDGVICSGPRIGNQFSYALLEERALPAKKIEMKEALGRLVNRFFASRGPATVQDFVYWSNMTVKQAREGLELLDKQFVKEKFGEQEYFFIPSEIKNEKYYQRSFLMPDYDEYGMSYKDKSFMAHKRWVLSKKSDNSIPHYLIMDGVVVGTWKLHKKTEGRNKITVLDVEYGVPLSKAKQKEADKLSERYFSFTK